MADHTHNAFGAVIRSLEEVVIPQVDPEHPLALEQANLALRFLKLFGERFDYLLARNRFELQHYTDLAVELRDLGPTDSDTANALLSDALNRAERVGRDFTASVASVRDAVADLTQAVSAVVRASAQSPQALEVERVVLERTQSLLDAQRVWFLPQGWENDASQLPSFTDIFDRQAAH